MVYIFLATGFEETEAIVPCDLLRRAGLDVALAGVNGIEIVGSHKITVRADIRGVESLLSSRAALSLTKRAWEAGKYVCAICAAPTILASLGILGDSPAVCYPGKEPQMGQAEIRDANVVRAGRLITARAAGASVDFALALIEALKGREEAERIAKQIVYIRD